MDAFATVKSRTSSRKGQPSPGRASSNHGLGITESRSQDDKEAVGIPETTDWTPVSLNGNPSGRRTPGSMPYTATTPLMTSLSGSTQCDETFSAIDTAYKADKQDIKRQASSVFSVANSCLASLHSISQKQLLSSSAPTLGSVECETCGSSNSPRDHTCHGSRNLKKSMWSWSGSWIMLMSAVATALSGLFFFVGATGPTYGNKVGTHGLMTASSAAFWTAVFAKAIESMSAFLVAVLIGQVLARKAYSSDKHRGVSLAQITMRYWTTQPGTMFSHWSSVRYAALSTLGLIAILAATMVLLYTSAAAALVQPQLKFAQPEYRMLQSQVYSQFANAYYVQQTCKTPITHLIDHHPDEIDKSCVQIEHASQAYHNYKSWISHWTDVALIGNGTTDLATRPPGWALLHDNTTISAPWIERDITNATYWLEKTGWVVNNVTMAMPHPGVVSAAVDESNGIMQPDQLDGLGVYSIRASVPVPFVNVMCVMGMSEADLLPVFINTTYDTTEGTGTALDDIFHWGPKWGLQKWPPVFDQLPTPHNSIVNDTTKLPYGRDAIYILGQGGDVDQAGSATNANYALCSVQVGQTPHCSTEYTASSHGGTLEAICEDPTDELQYARVVNDTRSGNETISKEWVNIGSGWANSVSLNDGKVKGNSSNVRVWTQLFLSNTLLDANGNPTLSIAMPSPAEALAVLSSCTLLESARDSPFVQFWNYSSPILTEPGQTQYFNASIRAQQYASGGTAAYQKGFLVVLAVTFLLNAYILGYLVLHRHWYLDFGDPVTLFPLAINSPPSKQSIESSCEVHGEEMQFRQFWKLRTTAEGHVYLEIPEEGENGMGSPTSSRKSLVARGFACATRPLSAMVERLRRD